MLFRSIWLIPAFPLLGVLLLLARTVPLTETFKGVMPFLVSDFLRIAAMLFFPALSLVLVRTFQT